MINHLQTTKFLAENHPHKSLVCYSQPHTHTNICYAHGISSKISFLCFNMSIMLFFFIFFPLHSISVDMFWFGLSANDNEHNNFRKIIKVYACRNFFLWKLFVTVLFIYMLRGLFRTGDFSHNLFVSKNMRFWLLIFSLTLSCLLARFHIIRISFFSVATTSVVNKYGKFRHFDDMALWYSS